MGLGSDFSCGPDSDGNIDISPALDLCASEELAYLEACARRLASEGLFYDPTYGKDLILFLGATHPPSVIAQHVESTLGDDERTLKVQVDASYITTENGDELELVVYLDTELGPYEFTFTIDKAGKLRAESKADGLTTARLTVAGGT